MTKQDVLALESSSAASWQINWRYMHHMKKQASRDGEIEKSIVRQLLWKRFKLVPLLKKCERTNICTSFVAIHTHSLVQ